MSTEVGPVREEAERLVAAVLARFPPGGSRGAQEQDGERARRVAAAAGDVAVAVTALLRELAQTPRERAQAGDGLREGYARFATRLVESAGVDLLGDPPTTGASGGSESPPGDVWRAATRTGRHGEAPAGTTDAAAQHTATQQTSGAEHGTVSTDTDEVERTDHGDAHDRS